jgi:tetratricopeptide (TPR) repeat protein
MDPYASRIGQKPDRGTAVRRLLALGALAVGCLGLAACVDTAGESDEIPITTDSEQARAFYLEGRDLMEKLRATDAHERFARAVELDPDFGLAHLGMAGTSASATEFFESLARAVELVDRVSDGERRMILGVDAEVKREPVNQREHYTWLVEHYPRDERAHHLLGGYYFSRKEYETAIEHYEAAIRINPQLSQSYNLLGYSLRALEQYDEAAAAFEKYIELIPDEPNPYDSYAELLMKVGEFERSIENYEKALAIDANFVPSYVGIGNDYIFMGDFERARETFDDLLAVARNDGERRTALYWVAASYLYEGDLERALERARERFGMAQQAHDLTSMADDHVLMGYILLNAGRFERAREEFELSVARILEADVPPEVKQATERLLLYNEARVALAAGDLPGAKAKTAGYRKLVELHQIPSEIRRTHELAGRIAIEEGQLERAVAELEQADQQNPRIIYLLAVATRELGDHDAAREIFARAASWNALDLGYAFVREKARRMADSG